MAEEEAKQYFQKHQLEAYVSDAIDFLLKRRKSDPKYDPFDILSEYFRSVITGNHIAFREYGYVSLTPYNRACFVKLFSDCFGNFEETQMLMSEYCSLLQLFCFDIPSSLMDDIALVFFADNIARTEVPILFSKFLKCFRVILYYQPFLRKCRVAYNAVMSVGCKQLHSGHVVVVPTTATNLSRPTSASVHSPRLDRASKEVKVDDGLEPALFYKIVKDIISKMSEDQFEEVCPDPSALQDMEQSKATLSFGDFLRKLVSNELIQKEFPREPLWKQLQSPSSPEC